MIAASHYFLFYRKDLDPLLYKSEMEEGLSHEIKSTSYMNVFGCEEEIWRKRAFLKVSLRNRISGGQKIVD